jgi:hypothetical protein
MQDGDSPNEGIPELTSRADKFTCIISGTNGTDHTLTTYVGTCDL